MGLLQAFITTAYALSLCVPRDLDLQASDMVLA